MTHHFEHSAGRSPSPNLLSHRYIPVFHLTTSKGVPKQGMPFSSLQEQLPAWSQSQCPMISVFGTTLLLFRGPNSALIICGYIKSHPKFSGFKPQFINLHGFMGWLSSAGWFSVRVSPTVAVRCQLGGNFLMTWLCGYLRSLAQHLAADSVCGLQA